MIFRNSRAAATPFLLLIMVAGLSACGTTYEVPKASLAHTDQAKAMFEQEQNPSTAVAGRQLSQAQAQRQFERVARRVEPVAEAFCRRQTANQPGFDCDIQVIVDNQATERNAYQTYSKNHQPQVYFTSALIADARNPDELAFVMGHEMGHHLGAHIEKKTQQAAVGGLLLGLAVAAAGAGTYQDPVLAQQNVELAFDAGAALGQMAFSQTYELESDMIATYIAKSAGYDPVKGARFFARPEDAKQQNGQLSFWGTHPPDEKRMATVLATMSVMQASSDAKNPPLKKPETE